MIIVEPLLYIANVDDPLLLRTLRSDPLAGSVGLTEKAPVEPVTKKDPVIPKLPLKITDPDITVSPLNVVLPLTLILPLREVSPKTVNSVKAPPTLPDNVRLPLITTF